MLRTFAALAFAVAIAFATSVSAAGIERVKTPAGIEIWLKQEPAIPMIALEVAWRDAGSTEEPADRAGLARLLAAMLGEGAGELDSQAFKGRLQDLASSISFSADRDDFRASARTLTRNREATFRLLGQALTSARFDAEPMQRLKAQTKIRLSREKEDPGSIVARALWETAYPDHPYGRNHSGSPETIDAVSADDMRRFLGTRIARDNIVIGIVGDVAIDEAARLVDLAFANLPPKAEKSAVAPVAARTMPSPVIVPRDMPQSQVQFAARGIARDDPDFYAAHVMNYILGGGGFGSRLTEEVREKKGLAYSVFSYLAPMRRSALFAGGFGTQNERAGEALEIVRGELRRMRDTDVTAEELANAKTYLNGSFPLQLSSNSRIAGMLVSIQLDRLGADYLEKRAGYIDAVSSADIRRVAARLLDPDGLLVVVVGRPVGIGG